MARRNAIHFRINQTPDTRRDGGHTCAKVQGGDRVNQFQDVFASICGGAKDELHVERRASERIQICFQCVGQASHIANARGIMDAQ